MDEDEERGNRKRGNSNESSNDDCCLLANNSSSSDEQQESSQSEVEEGSDEGSSVSGRRPETIALQSVMRSLPGEKSMDKTLPPNPVLRINAPRSPIESEDDSPGY